MLRLHLGNVGCFFVVDPLRDQLCAVFVQKIKGSYELFRNVGLMF
jgi:hypothetical protein